MDNMNESEAVDDPERMDESPENVPAAVTENSDNAIQTDDVNKDDAPKKDVAANNDDVGKNDSVPQNQDEVASKKDDVVVLDDDENEKGDDVVERRDVEVIDLVPPYLSTDCINFQCKSGKDLKAAPLFCISYYRLEKKEKKCRKVCEQCYNEAIVGFNKLIKNLQSEELLFNVDIPFFNDLVEIDDSDEEEEPKVETNYIDKKNVEFISQNIDLIIDEIAGKFNLDELLKNEEVAMTERCTKTESELVELKKDFKSMMQRVDKIHHDFYERFKPVVKESNMSADIIDDFTYQASLKMTQIPTNSEPVRKKLRQTPQPESTKPTSPIESDHLNIINSGSGNAPAEPADLPKIGTPIKPPLKIGETYYISRDVATGSWLRARFMNSVPTGGPTNKDTQKSLILYKFLELKQLKERVVSGKNIAYMNSALTRLRVGDRVVASFSEANTTNRKTRCHHYYPGIVAEPPYATNNFRYLIFFDIGHSRYVPYDLVNLIYEASEKVWEDMPVESRSFIKNHIERQDWPMVKLKKDESVITEYNGTWYMCSVINVDCSLVQVYFDVLNRAEWIYRGSMRIKEIYNVEKKSTNRAQGQRASRSTQNESKNVVHYTPNVNYSENVISVDEKNEVEEKNQSNVRSVARKSTAKPQQKGTENTFLPTSGGPTSKIMYFTPRDQRIINRPYYEHECSEKCREYLTNNFNKLHGQNPLSKPLLCGWARMSYRVRGRKEILYRTPCGKNMRNIAEVHYYLSITKSEITVDLFDFNHMVRCLAEFNVDCTPVPPDLSRGAEQVRIPVINGINSDLLEFCDYSTKRVPLEGVNMNLDPDFLVCCDCDDDCIDKTKCACWKLTLEGASFFDSTVEPNSVGYIYRRLQEQVVTGIYECNSRCKCSKTCLNRVAQNPMSLKLQVFRTHNRGWGIRCLNDIPQGTFICVYAGTINTDQRANEDGKTFGDEYFAELDYIESVEKYKEDFEKEVEEELDKRSDKVVSPNEDEEEEVDAETPVSGGKGYMTDNEFIPSVPVNGGQIELRTRLRKRKTTEVRESSDKEGSDSSNQSTAKSSTPKKDKEAVNELAKQIVDTVTISDDEDDVKEVLCFNPKDDSTLDDKSKYPSVRQLYGADENIYIMDAKNSGNIGRFLNHSCAPNVFVQNVFIDSHDPRFPWVAFFSSHYIRAGTELTWNYSYDVGSVPGKILYCHCAALECKGRLL